jgi:hypothetical protein
VSILPDILDVAQGHGLRSYPRQTNRGETRFNCPFCVEQGRSEDREYKLYLGVGRDGAGIFRCMRCGERGGVLRMMSLLEQRSESKILERLKEGLPKRKKASWETHPAMKLTSYQWRLLGFLRKVNAGDFKRDPERARNTLQWVWQEWENFSHHQLKEAFRYVCFAYHTGKFDEMRQAVAKREQEKGIPKLWERALKIHSIPKDRWSEEMIQMDQFQKMIANKSEVKHHAMVVQSAI